MDGRLQIRLAKLFRDYLHKEDGISLRTISRLVVLAYICADLARERGDELLIVGTKKRITVDTVDLKLRRAGLDKIV